MTFSERGVIRLSSRAKLLKNVLALVQYKIEGSDALLFEEYDCLKGVASCTPQSLNKASCVFARIALCLSDHGAN